MRKLKRDELKNLKGGFDMPVACESACVGDGPEDGCESGEKCENITCESDPQTCHYICISH